MWSYEVYDHKPLGETTLTANMLVSAFWKPAVVIGGLVLLLRKGSKKRRSKNGLGYVPVNGLGDFGLTAVALLGGGAYLVKKFLEPGAAANGGQQQQQQGGNGDGQSSGGGGSGGSGASSSNPASTADALLKGGVASAGAIAGGIGGGLIGHAASTTLFGTGNVPVATTLNTAVGASFGTVAGGMIASGLASGQALSAITIAGQPIAVLIPAAFAVMWGVSLGTAIWAQETGNTLTDQMDKAREARYSGKPWTADASQAPAQKFTGMVAIPNVGSVGMAWLYDVASVAAALKDGQSPSDILAYDIADPKYSLRGVSYASDTSLMRNSNDGISITNPYAKKDARGNLVGGIFNVHDDGTIEPVTLSAKLQAAVAYNQKLVAKWGQRQADARGQIYQGTVSQNGATSASISPDSGTQRIAAQRGNLNPLTTGTSTGQDFGKADQSRRIAEGRLADRGLDGIFNFGYSVEEA